MTDKIQIFDAFLTPEEVQTCADAVKRHLWSFGQISQTSPISTPFWMMNQRGLWRTSFHNLKV